MLRIINENDYIELKEICDQVREGKLILDIVNRHIQNDVEIPELEELEQPTLSVTYDSNEKEIAEEPVEIKKIKKTTKK